MNEDILVCKLIRLQQILIPGPKHIVSTYVIISMKIIINKHDR